MRVGCRLAQQQNRPLHLIAVQRTPLTGPDHLPGELPYAAHSEIVRREGLSSAALAQLNLACEKTRPAGVDVSLDEPAGAVVRRAEAIGAAVIVVGLGRPSGSATWSNGETTLEIVRLAHVPVLAVPADAEGLPIRAVVAVDFSAFSFDAACAASDLLGDDAELRLVHVTWSPGGTRWETEEIWLETYRTGAVVRLEDLAKNLSERRGQRIRTALLDGPAGKEILLYAQETDADLVVGGSHGYGFLGRLVMGSVARHLLRAATVSVLITPPRLAAEAAASNEPRAASNKPTARSS